MATPGRKPKRKLQTSNSPLQKKSKNVKTNSETDCLVCEEPILESGEHCEGDEAVFCEGDCQGWIHRKCGGMTHSAFNKLGESDTSYLFSQCMLANQNKEISKLTNIIRDLNASIVSLTETINSLQSSTSIPILSPSKPHANAQKPVLNSLKDSADTFHDHQYCFVVYGIPENPTGMQ